MQRFTRHLLSLTHADVRKAIPGVTVMEAWVYHLDNRDHWEFHYRDFYWHSSAGDAYDARSKGWSAYLDSIEKRDNQKKREHHKRQNAGARRG